MKALNKTLRNDEYDAEGNLIGLRQLVRDPLLTECGHHKSETAAKVLAGWFEQEPRSQPQVLKPMRGGSISALDSCFC